MMRTTIFALLIASTQVAHACIEDGDKPIIPTNESAFGVSVSKLSQEYSKITVLTPELFCKNAKVFDMPFESSVFSFRVDKDFNSDGKIDTAFVGTYAKKNQETGIFLAVIENLGSPSQKVIYLKDGSGSPVFSYLVVREDSLDWPTCAACDFAVNIKFGRAGFKEETAHE